MNTEEIETINKQAHEESQVRDGLEVINTNL